MDLATWLLLTVIFLMLANRALHLGEHWYRRRGLFWAIQLANFLGACLLVTMGIPGFEGALRIINLMLAGLLVLHTVQNNRHYVEARRGEAVPTDAERESRRALVLDKLSGPAAGDESGKES